ncbi:tetratricopeptide repeat protein [Hyphococcus sp. DH-69]|uniref:tetratricopeptide repeat protein n=1 Tax=Hyphococcus formosus TaxID=3143534 RepID=UPI00398B0722
MTTGKFNRSRSAAKNSAKKRTATWLLAVSALAMASACASPEEKAERYAKEGTEFLEEGDLAKAYIQFQNALKNNEEHVPTLLGLAEIAEQRQDFEAMFGFLQRAVRLDPTQIDAQIRLGKLYLISSDETSALEKAEKALELDPNSTDAKSLKAGILLKIGDNAGAVDLAREVLAEDPKNAEAVTVVVTDLSVKGDREGALAELEKALELNPQVAMLQLLRIHTLKSLGRNEEAHSAYADLIELFPNQSAYRRVYANELITRKEFDAAREQMEAIVELNPDSLEAKLDVIRIVKVAEGVDAAEAKLKSYIDAEPENTQLQFALADFYIGEGQQGKSDEQLKKLAESKDQDIAFRAKNKVAASYLSKGEIDKAKPIIDEILAADDRNTEALIKLAALQIDNEEYDEAIVNLRTALNNNPDAHDAMLLMSVAFERQDNFSFAQSELAKAYDKSKRDPKISNRYARFLLRRKNVDRAEQILEDSLASHPADIDNLQLLASIRLSRQDWRGAEEIATQIENYSNSGELSSSIKSAAYIGLQDFDSVINTLSAQAEDAPLKSRPLTALVSAYVKEERADEAKELLERILETDEDNYTARILLARVYTQQGNMDAYEQTLIDATEHDPSRAEAFELLYRTYLGDGRRDEAAALIERGLRANPESDALRVFKADVLLNQGNREGALELYDELIEARPTDRIIANNFVSLSSDLRTDAESIARALKVSEAIAEIENPYYQDTVGWANYRAGNYAKAVEHLTKAVDGAGNNAEMLYHLGAAQLANGDKEAAKTSLESALSAGGSGFRYENEVRGLLAQL